MFFILLLYNQIGKEEFKQVERDLKEVAPGKKIDSNFYKVGNRLRSTLYTIVWDIICILISRSLFLSLSFISH